MSKAREIKYSIVVPAYKEADLIDSSLHKIKKHLEKHNVHHLSEIVVVAADGGDDTAKKARKHADHFASLQVIEPGPKVGKGRDVGLGVKAAQGDYILFTDADLATPAHHIIKMFNALERGADMAIGVRNLRQIHKKTSRRWSSRMSNLLIKSLVVRGIHDTQCGFKGFTKKTAHELFSRQKTHGWGFDIELLALAQRLGHSIDHLHIHDWSDPKDEGLTGESPFKAMVNTLRELFSIRLNLWTRQYDLS